ncbi:MAG: FAD-linked oxidase [Zetaproteobacteria bacterium CG_4_9_14_3_um_filter_53_7]|nr:MAG: FAD-linked oxidase [Zetaproteobacteria bacterium CG_4_9_14_3_um_filter_53_7]
MSENIREIPYNYTSYSDREIVIRFLGEDAWDDLNVLRTQRRTGRSARMLFEILGDLWVVERNIFLRNDLLKNQKRRQKMYQRHYDRLARISKGASDNPRAQKVAACTSRMLEDFYAWFDEEPIRRKRAVKAFSRHTHPNNVHFDAYTLTHHATDATDWRHHAPFCVLTPDSADELPGLIRATAEQELVVIPRGGGTGLCGGSVPLSNNAVLINVEKLDYISPVLTQDVGEKGVVATITASAGAVTGKVMEASLPHVFATDPTSLWACTIGGNVASNAGGKHAVIWGTCVDNLLSWKMVTPDGNWLTVQRINHNMGKVHDEPEVCFRLIKTDSVSGALISDEILPIKGSAFRKEGLGKDVTRKAMGGLPGVQKEGTDGFIVEATFVLHRAFEVTRTVCCEFFGQELSDATKAMVKIKHHVDALEGAHLEGLEHFDEKYVKAIEYISKSPRREAPRVVLLIDVSGDDEHAVGRACADICRITSNGNGEGFVATSEADRKRFWGDRGRMAAIAKHTRAFKMNEDVVIPLDRLSEYNDYVEHLNIDNSILNKKDAIESISAYLDDARKRISGNRLETSDLNLDDDPYLTEKLDQCIRLIATTRENWCRLLKGMDEPAREVAHLLEGITYKRSEPLFRVIQRSALRISYRDEVEKPLCDMLRGHDTLIEGLKKAHKKALSGRIVVATHMHAGDGNVHTNIPVNSNDYAMMKKAHRVVEKVMAKAVELGGVISGEHGIGITKLEYMDKTILQETAEYLKRVDPGHLFNRGKLMPDTDLRLTYTPSFNLLEMESMILEAADLTDLSEAISPCLRCGKCKPVCNTHFPRANMLYSPRNKIQASGAMIEAFLYESQTGSGISFEQFEGMHDIADHCTICHKCESPCPVNIDFGDVTEKMRALLKDKGQARFNLGSKLSMLFLTLQNPNAVRFMREVVIRWGYAGHRMLNRLGKLSGLVRAEPAASRNLEGVQAQVINFIERPLPALRAGTARQKLGIESSDKNMIPVLRDPKKANGRTVFYFPGCGSERLFSQVGLATQAMLFELGVNVVLPPSYLCCGYPSTASGDHEKGDQITYDNRVLFHRIRNALSYLDFEAVIVSCGTCYDQLTKYELGQVFPDAPLIDIHEYLMEQGVKTEAVTGTEYMYHVPCHSPLKRHGTKAAIETLLGSDAVKSEDCCGEAGTLAVAQPAIAGKIRMRKEEQMQIARAKMPGVAEQKILTSCPSCLQGLSRLEGETGIEADYIVIELVKHLHGEDWQKKFIEKVKHGGIERVLM